MTITDQLDAIELRLRHTAAHQRLTEDQMDARKLVAALRHAVAVAGEMRQGSHQDRIIRYEGMIGKIAGILDGEG